MEDRESWLAAHLEKEPEGAKEASALCGAAALLRAALNAIDVPEHAQSQARARGLEQLQKLPASLGSEAESTWLTRFGSWLQLAFNLFKRR